MSDLLFGAGLAGWLAMVVGLLSRREWIVGVGLVQVGAALGLQGALWLVQHVRVTP